MTLFQLLTTKSPIFIVYVVHVCYIFALLLTAFISHFIVFTVLLYCLMVINIVLCFIPNKLFCTFVLCTCRYVQLHLQ